MLKTDLDILYQIAKHIQRRLGAVEWLWNYIWDEKARLYLENAEEKHLYIRIRSLKLELGY